MTSIYRDETGDRYFINFSIGGRTKEEVNRIYAKLAELEVEFCETLGDDEEKTDGSNRESDGKGSEDSDNEKSETISLCMEPLSYPVKPAFYIRSVHRANSFCEFCPPNVFHNVLSDYIPPCQRSCV